MPSDPPAQDAPLIRVSLLADLPTKLVDLVLRAVGRLRVLAVGRAPRSTLISCLRIEVSDTG